MSAKNIKKELKMFTREYDDSIKVQSSSTKILLYLVNDLLDLGQLRSGKFRKDISNFNIKEAINEIMSIQSYKAEFLGIKLTLDMHNFPMKSKLEEFDYLISSDL